MNSKLFAFIENQNQKLIRNENRYYNIIEILKGFSRLYNARSELLNFNGKQVINLQY